MVITNCILLIILKSCSCYDWYLDQIMLRFTASLIHAGKMQATQECQFPK